MARSLKRWALGLLLCVRFGPAKSWRYYSHRCANGEDKVLQGVRVCPVCGQAGNYAGRDCSSTVEYMARYHQRTGLKPIGPHRRFADQVLSEVLRRCTECAGSGYCERPFRSSQTCPVCDGRGTIPAPTDPLMQAALRLIEEQYPGACTTGVLSSASRPLPPLAM